MVVLSRDARLTADDLPTSVLEEADGSDAALEGFNLPAGGVQLSQLERHLIEQALRRTRGSLGQAARLLGISYKTLQYRIRKYGLGREEFDEP
jgi:DNA-binding NtrC family response regulator